MKPIVLRPAAQAAAIGTTRRIQNLIVCSHFPLQATSCATSFRLQERFANATSFTERRSRMPSNQAYRGPPSPAGKRTVARIAFLLAESFSSGANVPKFGATETLRSTALQKLSPAGA